MFGSGCVPDTIEQSQRYLSDFSRIVVKFDDAETIVDEMLALHGDRQNPRVLWHCARAAVR